MQSINETVNIRFLTNIVDVEITANDKDNTIYFIN